MTLTTFDEKLCRIVEPNVSTTVERYNTLKTMQKNNIPTVVWLSPLLPFINDTEANLRGILDYCFDAKVQGIICFGIGLTLGEGNREYYYEQLDKHFPHLKEKYMQKYGYSYEIVSDNNDKLMEIFHDECAKHKVMHDVGQIFHYMSELPDKTSQISMF